MKSKQNICIIPTVLKIKYNLPFVLVCFPLGALGAFDKVEFTNGITLSEWVDEMSEIYEEIPYEIKNKFARICELSADSFKQTFIELSKREGLTIDGEA
jgi:hypothetical protein